MRRAESGEGNKEGGETRRRDGNLIEGSGADELGRKAGVKEDEMKRRNCAANEQKRKRGERRKGQRQKGEKW